MSERARIGINWTLALSVTVSAISGVWMLAGIASDVAGARVELKGIREDFKAIQAKVQDLDIRTTRLEERNKVSMEWRDSTKGNP